MPPMSQNQLDELNQLFASISNGVSYAGGTVVGASCGSLNAFCDAIEKIVNGSAIEEKEKPKKENENEWEEISV